jgi:aspartate racemase
MNQTGINIIIFEELCHGGIKAKSRKQYCSVIRRLTDKGAEELILGYSEIDLLINQSDSDLPLFDTTEIHARETVNYALSIEEI